MFCDAELKIFDPRSTLDEFTTYLDELPTPAAKKVCPVMTIPEPEEVVDCTGIIINEVGANLTEQYIEILNPTENVLPLAGCGLETSASDARYVFTQETLGPGEFMLIAVQGVGIKLHKTVDGKVYLLTSDDVEIDVQEYPELDEDTSWSRFDDGWYQTFALTPGAENVDMEYPPCDEGYYRNAETGRCNQIPVEEELKPCDIGQYRSAETNRCRNLSLPSSLKPCRADQYRNPETNRCRSLASKSSLKPCKENQYRSEETNRCRNKTGSSLPEAAFKVQPIDNQESAFAGWLALGGVGAVAGGYAGWEWRRELANAWRRLFGIFKK